MFRYKVMYHPTFSPDKFEVHRGQKQVQSLTCYWICQEAEIEISRQKSIILIAWETVTRPPWSRRDGEKQFSCGDHLSAEGRKIRFEGTLQNNDFCYKNMFLRLLYEEGRKMWRSSLSGVIRKLISSCPFERKKMYLVTVLFVY